MPATAQQEKIVGWLFPVLLFGFVPVMIFYSALTKLDKGGKFKTLIEKCSLLKSLPKGRLLNPEHLKLYDGRAYS